jgi:predicted nucleic acid-binding protein
MQLYLDTSALVKLVVQEPESSALEAYLREYPADARFTSALARTELVRAVTRQQSIDSIAHARRVLARMNLVPLTNRLLDAAATMMKRELRTLDALHISAALTAPTLRAVVTYDNRMSQAVAEIGIAVATPR